MSLGDFFSEQLGNNQCNCNTNGLDVAGVAGIGADCCPIDNNDVLGVAGAGNKNIEVPEVLGINTGNVFVEVCIPILPPGFAVLYDLIEKRLVFDALVASNGRVFINGRLIKKIPFETCDSSVVPTSGNISRITLSNVRAVTVEVPFGLCIPLKESVKGARVVVLDYDIDSVEIPNLRCPQLPCVRTITEKDCITIKVKVEQDTIITVRGTPVL